MFSECQSNLGHIGGSSHHDARHGDMIADLLRSINTVICWQDPTFSPDISYLSSKCSVFINSDRVDMPIHDNFCSGIFYLIAAGLPTGKLTSNNINIIMGAMFIVIVVAVMIQKLREKRNEDR